MRLLRTIFTQHKHHPSNHKFISSSPIPLRSLQTSNTDHSSEAVEEPQTQTNESDNTKNHHQPSSSSSSSGWSMYSHVFDTPVTHHSGHNEVEEQEEEEGEKASVGILKMSERVGRSTIGTKKKEKTHWVCCNCGYTTGKWWGTCSSCDITGTMKEFHEAKSTNGDNKLKTGLTVSEDAVGLWLPHKAAQLRPVKLEEVNSGFDQDQWRIPLSGSFGSEVSTVLGGGLVPGSLTLISGDPGVGKSTLLLQIAALIAEGPNDGEASPVLYVSGEESLQQIGNRANRLGIKSDIHLYSSTDIEDILKKAQGLSLRALIVDSIQTVYLKGIVGSAGGIMQVKECTTALMRFSKTTNIPVLLIGHVTKSGDIAGPRVLEHIVDVVLYMEGEKYSSYRMLRAMKNRFGSADELGVFEMSQSGLQSVSNASEIFLSEQPSDSIFLAGLAITVIMDGSRTFLIEIQALCVSPCPVPVASSGLINGIQINRANMIKCAVFFNVVSGLTMTETAGDLAIAAAICSSFLEFPIPKGIAFIGEIGLGGELRMVPRMEKRVYTVAKLGYRICVVPKQAEEVLEAEGLEKMRIVGCENLKEVIDAVFRKR